MRRRWLVVLTAVAIVIVGFATLDALRGDDPSSDATTVDVSGLRPGEVVPVHVTLPDADRSEARVFVVHPSGRPVMAFLGVSTHLGCRLLYRDDPTFGDGFSRVDQFAFEDPCGGSTFTLDGRCVGGPCPRDLDRYEVELVDHTATFDLHDLVRGPPRGSASALPATTGVTRVR